MEKPKTYSPDVWELPVVVVLLPPAGAWRYVFRRWRRNG